MLPVALQTETQRIGMGMTVTLRNGRRAVDHHLMATDWKHVHTSGLKGGRCCCGALNLKVIPYFDTVLAQKPDRLLPQTACELFEIPPIEENGSRSQRIEQVRSPIPAGIEDPAAIVVTKPGGR